MVSQVGPRTRRARSGSTASSSSADQPDREVEAHVRRVEQRAVAAVVDEERVAPAGIDAHDERLGLRHQGAARLAHQSAALADGQALDPVGNRPHEGRERRRRVLVIDRREAAADIEAIEHHASPGDQLAYLGQRGREGLGRCRLRADVEGDAELLGRLPRLHQQPRGLGPGGRRTCARAGSCCCATARQRAPTASDRGSRRSPRRSSSARPRCRGRSCARRTRRTRA